MLVKTKQKKVSETGKKKSRISKIVFSKREITLKAPDEIVGELQKEFHFTAKPSGRKALTARQWGKSVFVNPPLKDSVSWVEKGLKEIERGHTQTAVYLLKDDVSTSMFHELVIPNAVELRAMRGRLSLGHDKGNSSYGSIIAIFKKSRHGSRNKNNKKNVVEPVSEMFGITVIDEKGKTVAKNNV